MSWFYFTIAVITFLALYYPVVNFIFLPKLRNADNKNIEKEFTSEKKISNIIEDDFSNEKETIIIKKEVKLGKIENLNEEKQEEKQKNDISNTQNKEKNSIFEEEIEMPLDEGLDDEIENIFNKK